MTSLNIPSRIESVIKEGFCIGCGACAVNNNAIQIKEDGFGFFTARIDHQSKHTPSESAACPFASDRSEDAIAQDLYGKTSQFDKRIGFYRSIYAGHVAEGDYRRNGSSGGMVTWILSRLFSEGEIDGVIHVGETGRVGDLFEYRISETLHDIETNSKSRYYPVHMDDVLQRIREGNKQYAFVGVPCFVKAVRLLAESDPAIHHNIKYCISIFCGHMKTKAFGELIAWQLGVQPDELAGIDFRVKDPTRSANQYGIQVTKSKDMQRRKLEATPTRELYGMDWGLGYFKPKACDWCDDVAGETADVACGDAWLPEFVHLPSGTNILVVRNERIADLIKEGIRRGQLSLSEQSADKVYESQAGNYRHRQEGLSARIAKASAAALWHPEKRIKANDYNLPRKRVRLYSLRTAIAERSHIYFREAKSRRSLLYFYLKMLPLELYYYFLDRRLLRGAVKSAIIFLKKIRLR